MESLVMVFFFTLLFHFSYAGSFTWLYSDDTVHYVEGETAKLNWSVQIGAGKTWVAVKITRSLTIGAGAADVDLIRRKPSGVVILLVERGADMDLDVQVNSNVLNVTFTLRNLMRKTDEMYYRITVVDDDPDTSVRNTKLNVDVPSSCAIHPNAATVNETDNVLLTVTTTGNPPVQGYTWTFPNGSTVSRDNNILTFPASRQDAGTYKVTVDNSVGGPSECTSNVTVQFKPRLVNISLIKDPLSTVREENGIILANETDSFNLICESDAKPAATYKWTVPDPSLFKELNQQILVFNNVSRDYAGEYICTASNIVGATNSRKNLTVYFPSSCAIHPNATTVNETDNVLLTVTTTGNPPVQGYTWTFPNGSTVSRDNNILTFPASRQDAGTYKVTVDNGVGGPRECTSDVTVQYPPSNISILPPRTQITIKERDRLYMRCQGDSYPPPTYTWKHNGMTLIGKQNGILEFKSINRRQNGTYRCEAKNHLGSLLSEPVDITVQYLDDFQVIGSSNKSYSQSNPLVLFNLSVNAYPVRNTTLTCNPSVPNVMTVITNYKTGLQYKHYLVVVIIHNVVETANITCIAENSMDKQEKTLFFYRQSILFKEQFEAQFKMTNQEWQDELKDPKTTEYKNLAKKCIKIIENAYSGLPYLAGVNIKKFLKGSILVRFELEVIGQVSDPLLPLRDYIKRQGGEMDGLQIDYNSIQTSSEVKDDSPIPVPEANKTLVAVLGALLALSIILNILLIAAGFLWLRRKDSRAFKKRSNKSDEIGQMNEISMQETSLNDNPNVPEYEPIGRRGLATSNSGIPEYEAVSTRTQPTQPQSAVESNNPIPQYESADRHRLPGADSNTPSVTYQTIQPRTGAYRSLSPSTRLAPKDTSTGSPARTGDYQALHQKGVAPQYQSLDDLSRC